MVGSGKTGKAGAIGWISARRLEWEQVPRQSAAKVAAMKSAFPGMDPYIEARHIWGDFHDNFIVDIQRAIQRKLPRHYVARISDRTFVENYDPDLELMLKSRIGPDVAVQRKLDQIRSSRGTGTATAVVADPPAMIMHGQVEFEEREIYLDIYKLDPERQLVTSVELLSPANKRRGSVGWDQYERKRNIFLHGYANLVEIDLLRGGKRHPMSEPWPDSPYVIAVFRREKAPAAEIWPAYSLKPLPTIPIPLMPPDEDVVVELQPIVSDIFETSRYDGDVKYHEPIQPPLSSDEQRLVTEFLKQRGER